MLLFLIDLVAFASGTVCFLAAESDEDMSAYERGYETKLIEDLVEKLASIFRVEPDAAVSKPLQLMVRPFCY
jgi:hypothetical protein